ncbi:hypothetical protein thsrh120_56430 [Rhizobium sp. No.120]
MDDAGIKARHIYAALSIEDAELARMRSVYRTVPADIIEAIGRAPKIGRPRWLDLAKAISAAPNALNAARAALLDENAVNETSDQRFQMVLKAIKPPSEPRNTQIAISDTSGTKLGVFMTSPREVRISAEGKLGTEFVRFIEEELPDLIERFTRSRDKRNP